MTFKIHIKIEGEGRSYIAHKLEEVFDFENEQHEEDNIFITIWTKSLPIELLIELSEEFPYSIWTVDFLHDTTALQCSIENGEVLWQHECDYELDKDPAFSCLIEYTDKGCPVIPAIVPEEKSVIETLRCWGITAHEVNVRSYTEDECKEKGLVTHSQLRSLVQSA